MQVHTPQQDRYGTYLIMSTGCETGKRAGSLPKSEKKNKVKQAG